MLESFLAPPGGNPSAYLLEGGYRATIEWPGTGKQVLIGTLDIAVEAVQHCLLLASKAIQDEDPGISIIHYRGKHPDRWFAHVFPPALCPVVLGIFDSISGIMLGYVSTVRSFIVPGRRQASFYLIKDARGKGLGAAVVSRVLANASDACGEPVSEFCCSIANTNEPSTRLVKSAGFKIMSVCDPSHSGVRANRTGYLIDL